MTEHTTHQKNIWDSLEPSMKVNFVMGLISIFILGFMVASVLNDLGWL